MKHFEKHTYWSDLESINSTDSFTKEVRWKVKDILPNHETVAANNKVTTLKDEIATANNEVVNENLRNTTFEKMQQANKISPLALARLLVAA